MRLSRSDGPACPRCGCEDTEITIDPKPLPVEWPTPGRARCNHCGRIFSFTPEPSGEPAAADEEDPSDEAADVSRETTQAGPVACPDCGSTKVPVYRTGPTSKRPGAPLAHHRRCEVCKGTFKTPATSA